MDGQAPEIVFEATGVYSKPLERFLSDYGHTYYRMTPLETNLQMAKMRRHKTDVSDAHDNYYEQMRAITRYYDEVEEEIGHLRSRMHAILHLSFPELEQLITPNSALFLNFVQLYPHPVLLKEHSKTIIKNRLKNNTRKKLSLGRAE